MDCPASRRQTFEPRSIKAGRSFQAQERSVAALTTNESSNVVDRKSERYFLSERTPFLTASSFPNLPEQITVLKVHPCSWIWIERLCHGRHAEGRYG